MHVRLFPKVSAPAQICQFVTLSGEGGVDEDRSYASSLCQQFGAVLPENERYFVTSLSDVSFMWERHTEFATWTFIWQDALTKPFSRTIESVLPVNFIKELPGEILRATRIEILSREDTEPELQELEEIFSSRDLVISDVADGEARVWSDFRIHADGFGRLLIQDRDLAERDVPRLIQRLQELGNYRMMALLGLPVAQSLTPVVTSLERHLEELSRNIVKISEGEEVLLANLSELTAELAKISAETRYRMSATRAYASLVSDRLSELKVRRIRGYQTLADFNERRLTPAVRTCQSFSERLDDLSQRASWALSLMRTRSSTALERQNSKLLVSMNYRAGMQLRLQQTVEGLSVAAISYYGVGLIGYILKAGKDQGLPVDLNLMSGTSVPIIFLLTWFFLHKARARVSRNK